ncbi:unnamed protein product [Parnassius apollo]|uniref:(apollo) hypothetical protein n=1 Tax=Parnassius apollo TaxID=110799 RepID=A0A8S3WEW6_PARAO|nr:unnamed protein product [Parnassius apollo]
MGKHEQRGQHPPEEPNVKPEENSSTKKDTSEIQALTIALKEALTTRGGPVAQPKYIHELPYFDGNSTTEEGEFSDLTMVSKFLNSEADKCGAFATSEEKRVQKKNSTREKDFKEKDTRQSTEKTCPMCQGGHFPVDCQKFQKTSVQDRWATVKKSHVCFKFIQGKHRKESCKKPPCKEYKRWHHHLLHVESENRTSGEKKAETQEEVTR